MLSLLLPPSCGACGRLGPAPCADCWRALEPAPPMAAVDGLDRCRALLRYEGPARDLLLGLKYRNSRSTVAWLAAGMSGLAASPGSSFATVTWAPTTAARRRRRGFDQAEVLARAVGRRLGVPVRRLLVRLPGPAQTGSSRLDRAAGPVFVVRGPVAGKRLLLVDDVVTTGATLAAAGASLTRAGAAGVEAVVAGCTPLKVPSPAADA